MNLIFFETKEAEQSNFKDSFAGTEVSFFEEKLDENNVEKVRDADAICIFVNSVLDKKVIDALPNLKFIAIRATGYNNIDCAYAKSKGIKISNVPAYGSHTIAEFTFGLILNLSRKVIKANNYIKESSDFHYLPVMEGFDLKDKTLGVIGTGKIGKNVIKIAKGFDMNVIAYDLYPDFEFSKENKFYYKNLDEVISGSDIITLHTPYNKENHHLINKENISKMKKGIYLINTARGELVDTNALVFGLKEGIIAGAGLDVLEGEQELKEEIELLSRPSRLMKLEEYEILLKDHILMEMPNVIVTPHTAFYTREAVAEILRVTTLNIQGFISGSLVNLVK